MSVRTFAYILLKGLSRPSKRKEKKWAGIVVKSRKR